MKKAMKKMIVLLLTIVLVTGCFAACDDAAVENNNVLPEQDNLYNNPGYSGTEDQNDNTTHKTDTSNTTPWIVDALKNGKDIDAYPFYEDLAYVRIDDHSYFIDREGNIKITLPERRVFASNEKPRFYSGLFFMEDYLINTEGESITAEDLGGTALHTTDIDYELLEAGYVVADRVTSDFSGATYESAIYNATLELVQPYSAELYRFFHDEHGYNRSFYNGYAYYEYLSNWKTYHIESNTFGEYDVLPEAFNRLRYNTTVGETVGLYRGNKLILDLSGQETLYHVECVGDLCLATFENEEGEGYFTVMGTDGKFKFEPILYSTGRKRVNKCLFNGNVILVKTLMDQPAGGKPTFEIKTFDINGKELGCITETVSSTSQLTLSLGEDTIVAENWDTGRLCYYSISLTPLFPDN